MEINRIITDTINSLKEVSSPEREKLSGWYFPTSMDVIGVKSEDLKTIIRDLRKTLSEYESRKAIELCIEMSACGIFEVQQVAFGILNRNFNLISQLEQRDLQLLGSVMDNWASTDSFGVQVSGPAWRLGVINDREVNEWSVSPDRWWRRIALVSTVALNLKSQKGEGDVERTLMICDTLAADKDDMVVKAMSWALRELSKRFPSEVRQFLSDNDDRLASRVKREVTRKLVTGRKNG